MITWTRAQDGKKDIYLSYKEKNRWGPEINLSHGKTRCDSPVLLSEGDRIAVFWKEQDEKLVLKSYSFYQLQKNRELKKKKTRIHSSSSHLNNNKFTCIGDSITFGSTAGPYQGNGYPPRLKVLLTGIFNSPCVSNKGLPGEATWEAVSRITSVITADLALFLLLMEGTNDVSDLNYSTNSILFNLKQMVAKSVEFGMYPLISTIIPRARNRWTTSAQVRTWDLNDRIRQLALDYPVHLIDNYDAFDTYSGGHEVLISSDNLHPNGLGYQVMAETWYAGINIIPFPPIEVKAAKKPRAQTNFITWQDDPKISSTTGLRWYRIYRKRSTSNSYSQIATLSASINSYTDINIQSDQDYDYKLSAINENSIEGPLSDPSESIMGEPYSPANIQAGTIENRAFLYIEHINRITWEENNENAELFNVTLYRIYRKRTGEEHDLFQLLGEVDASTFEYLDRGFSSSSEAEGYIYGVASVDEENNESLIGIQAN
jgi:lysophospholipase L1-like esterase